MSSYIDLQEANRLFNYNKVTGIITLKVNRGAGSKYKVGDSVGGRHECGPINSKKYYLRTRLNNKHVYVHRIIWVLVTGEQPEEIDHIDGDGLNNKWKNLRSVSHSVNGKNQKKHKNNTSGNSGVTFRKDSNKWRARIMVDDKSISLGTFTKKEDALSARLEAETKYW